MGNINDFIKSFEKQARKLTTKARKSLPSGSFVFPQERRYPIHDEGHARSALSMVAKHGTPSEQKAVKSAVHNKYPRISSNT